MTKHCEIHEDMEAMYTVTLGDIFGHDPATTIGRCQECGDTYGPLDLKMAADGRLRINFEA